MSHQRGSASRIKCLEQECAKTMNASSEQLAIDTSLTPALSKQNKESLKSDSVGSQKVPDQTTPAKSADNSGTQPSEVESATTRALSEVSSGQIKSIETVSPSKRIKWDEHSGFTGILLMDRYRWRKTFPAVKIDLELRMMHEWLLANPRKRKKNYYRYISSWLSRCQDVGGSSAARVKPAHCSGVYVSKPLSPEEIEAATKKNQEPGGNCDKINALKQLLANKITEEEYNRIVHD